MKQISACLFLLFIVMYQRISSWCPWFCCCGSQCVTCEYAWSLWSFSNVCCDYSGWLTFLVIFLFSLGACLVILLFSSSLLFTLLLGSRNATDIECWFVIWCSCVIPFVSWHVEAQEGAVWCCWLYCCGCVQLCVSKFLWWLIWILQFSSRISVEMYCIFKILLGVQVGFVPLLCRNIRPKILEHACRITGQLLALSGCT